MTIINSSEAISIVKGARDSGKVFGVWFVKRSNGHLRHMSCRGGVKKGVKGTPIYNPDNYGLIVVFDMRHGFRSIPMDSIKQLSISGVRFTVNSSTE